MYYRGLAGKRLGGINIINEFACFNYICIHSLYYLNFVEFKPTERKK